MIKLRKPPIIIFIIKQDDEKLRGEICLRLLRHSSGVIPICFNILLDSGVSINGLSILVKCPPSKKRIYPHWAITKTIEALKNKRRQYEKALPYEIYPPNPIFLYFRSL